MTYKYDGITREGKYRGGIVAADNEVEALAKIKERDDVLLITNLTKQSNSKVVKGILGVRDKQSQRFRNTLIDLRQRQAQGSLFQRKKSSEKEKKSNKPKEESRVGNIVEKLGIDRISQRTKTTKYEETYDELINIFNSEAFQELRGGGGGGGGQARVISDVGSDEGTSINWELLRSRSEIVETKQKQRIKVNKKDILLFTKRLQIMLASGMTLVDALRVLGSGNQKRGMSTLIEKLIESLQSGNSFSESLSLFPKQFDYLYVSLVSIGESSGTLHEILVDIINAKEQEYAISKKIKVAMVYPGIMGAVLVIMLLVGSIFFIPTFESMFQEQGMPLPTITTVVFAIAAKIPYVVISIIILVVLLLILKRKVPAVNKAYRKTIDKMYLSLPKLKDVKNLSYMHSFSFTISLMLRNGIRLKDALEMASETIENVYIKSEIYNISIMMSEGLTMSEAISQQKHFDDIIANVSLTGEESGNMSFALSQISEYYKSELDKAIETAMEFVEPMSISFIAIIVVPVIMALYLPILDISSGATLDL